MNIILPPPISGSNANKIVCFQTIRTGKFFKGKSEEKLELGDGRQVQTKKNPLEVGGMNIFRNNRFIVTKIDM